jgi:hypothetical protein
VHCGRADGADQNAAAAVGDVIGAALAPKSHCVNHRDLELIMVSADVLPGCTSLLVRAVQWPELPSLQDPRGFGVDSHTATATYL